MNQREELIRLVDDMDQKIGASPGLHPFPRSPLPEEPRDEIPVAFARLRSMLLRVQDLDVLSLSAIGARREQLKRRLSGMRQSLRASHSYSKVVSPPAKFLDVRK